MAGSYIVTYHAMLRAQQEVFDIMPDSKIGMEMAEAFEEVHYRREWVTEVYYVDQYGKRPWDGEVYYEKAWPTRDMAVEDLNRIAKPHPYVKGRMVSDLCQHEYHEATVTYREVKIQ